MPPRKICYINARGEYVEGIPGTRQYEAVVAENLRRQQEFMAKIRAKREKMKKHAG